MGVDEAKVRMKTFAILVVTLAIVFAVCINDCTARSVWPEPETLMSKKAVPVLHHLKERAVASQVFDHHRKDQVAMSRDDFLGSPSLSKLADDFDEGVGFTQ